MPEISFVTTCMGRLEHLQQSLPTWVDQSDSEIVVVDYSCPQRSGDWVERIFPDVKVLRIEGETYFNLAKGRNSGAGIASGRWLCMVDADVLLAPDFASAVKPLLNDAFYLRAGQGATPDLMGTTLVCRDAFEAIGGYDEVLEGWGGEDHDLYLRLNQTGRHQGDFPAHLVKAIPHDDEQRTEYAPIQDRILGWNINRLYLEGKMSLWRMLGGAPNLETRRSLYALVRKAVTENRDQKEVRVQLLLGANPRVTSANVSYTVVLVLQDPTVD